MMATIDNETLLTRFITLVKPEPITESVRSIYFSFHPDESTSDLYAESPEDFVDLRNEFTALSSTELIALNPDLFEFAQQVWRIRKSITVEKWDELFTEVNPQTLEDTLEDNQRKLVWDNFIFYATTQFEAKALDVCSYLLLADHWLRNYPESNDQKILTRLMFTKLVLPDFLKFETSPSISLMSAPDNPILSKKTLDIFSNARAVSESGTYLKSLRHLDEQLLEAHKKYVKLESNHLKEYNLEYEQALKEYYDQFNIPTFSVGSDDIPSGPSIPEGEITDTEPTDIEAPVYNYQPLPELDEERLAENLDEESMELLNELKDSHVDTFSELFEAIQKAMKHHESVILNQNTTSETLVNQDGMLLRVGEEKDPFSDFEGNTPTVPVTFFQSVVIHRHTGSQNKWWFTLMLSFNGNQVPVNGNCNIDNLETELTIGSIDSADEEVIKTGKAYALKFFVRKPLIADTSESEIEIKFRSIVKLNDGSYITIEENKVLEKTIVETVKPVITENNDEEVVIFTNIAKWGINRIGVGDYLKVTEKLCRYEPGEVSHIENVMAREYREKFSRRFNSSELTETSEESYESEQQTDTSTSERYETSREISKILQMSNSVNSNTNIQFGKDKGSNIVPTANTSFGIAFNNSREQSERMASTSSRELSEQATQRILIKKREERVLKIVNEFTEENRHGYDNRTGAEHVTGIYRWVDRIYEHTLTNYGKRLMYEFQVPEPASLHRLYVDNNKVEKLSKPVDPRVSEDKLIALKTYKDINDDNFAVWAADYNVEVLPPPERILVVGKAYSGTYEQTGDSGKAMHFDDFEVPDGYFLTNIDYSFLLEKHGDNYDNQRCGGSFSVCNVNIPFHAISNNNNNSNSKTSTIKFDSNNKRNNFGKIPVSVTTHDIGGFALNLNATFERQAAKYDEWRMQTFNAIITAYENALAAFEEKARRAEDEQQQKLTIHPRYYREIEEKVLKKNCISYMFEKLGHTDFSFIKGSKIDSHTITRSDKLDKYANVVKFLEQVFEWENMTYIFYPFYWGNKNNWEKLYYNYCEDALFKNFLESGFARVIVSVRPGFEDALSWYMQTGQIWIGKEPPVLNDEEHIAIVDDLQNQEPKVIDQWEVRLPSSLTVLQNKGVGVNTEGLPNLCGENPSSNNFVINEEKLSPLPPIVETPEVPEVPEEPEA